jgi:uncharacterized protein YbjT (DUF2867 family)
MNGNILVTAATGNVGSALLPLLADQGAQVRTLGHAAATDLDAALRGVDAVYLACGNVPGQVDFETSVIDAAARAGVTRIVKLSARGAAPGSPVAFWDWHARIEEHLAASGVPATVLRPSFLMTNLLAGAETVRQQGVLVAPAGDARVSMIDPRDVAAVAAVALAERGSESRTHTLTGPAALTWHEVAASASTVTGRRVTFVDVPPEAAVAAMVESGVPAFAASQIVNVFDALRAGAQSETTDVVPDLTGRPGRSLAEFLGAHADLFGRLDSSAVSR